MKEIEKEGDSLSHSSQLSLVRTRSSTAAASQSFEMADTIQDRLSLVRTSSAAAAASTASQSLEMTGAIQDAEADVEPEVSPPRRVDTEMGGRSQASGLEGGSPGYETQRRSTFPPWETNHHQGVGASLNLCRLWRTTQNWPCCEHRTIAFRSSHLR